MSKSKPKTAEAIFEEIRKLDPQERALLDALILEDDLHAQEDEGITRAWVDECNRRIKLIEEGKMKLIPAEEVFARLHARLDSMKP